MKSFQRLLIVLSLTAALLTAAVGLRRYCLPLCIAHGQKQLETAPDQSVEAILGHMPDSDELGVAILVEALGSPRQRIAQAARQTLQERIDHWSSLPGPVGSPKLALLAGELADRTGDLGPAGRHDAVPLAVQILEGPLDADAVDAVAVIGCCERVLRAAQADAASVVTDALAKRAKTDSTPATNPALHGGIATLLPFTPNQKTSEIDSSAGKLSQLQDIQPASDSLRLLPASDNTGEKSSAAGKVGLAIKPLRPIGNSPQSPAQADAATNRVYPSGVSETQPVRQASVTENLPAGGPSDVLKSVASFELLERTCSPNAAVSAPARAELSRRGFGEVHFDLAKRLFSADPAVRKQLARALPGLRSIDAAPWLLELGRDTDPDVRLTAIALMATSGDPSLLEEVERIAAEDPDPRIRQELSHISQQRNDAGHRGDSMAARPQPKY